MQRPTATAMLLVGAGAARAVSLWLGPSPDAGFDLLQAAATVDVVLPLAVALADLRGRAAAPTAAVVFGALGAARLMTTGLTALQREVPLDGPLLWLLVAAALATLAAGTAIGRWQDHGAPPPGPGRRWVRGVALLAGSALAVSLATTTVAVLGTIALEVGALPGPVAVATTLSLDRLPLLVGALLPLAWAATRAGGEHLRAAALVLGARAMVELAADTALLGLGAPVWPLVVGALVCLALLVVVPVGTTGAQPDVPVAATGAQPDADEGDADQVTSSSA